MVGKLLVIGPGWNVEQNLTLVQYHCGFFFSPLNFLVCVCVYIYINNKQVMQSCLVSIHKTRASPICIYLRIVSNLVVVGVAGAQMPTTRFKAG